MMCFSFFHPGGDPYRIENLKTQKTFARLCTVAANSLPLPCSDSAKPGGFSSVHFKTTSYSDSISALMDEIRFEKKRTSLFLFMITREHAELFQVADRSALSWPTVEPRVDFFYASALFRTTVEPPSRVFLMPKCREPRIQNWEGKQTRTRRKLPSQKCVKQKLFSMTRSECLKKKSP